MNAVARAVSGFSDTIMLKLAREIAMDIHPIEDILKAHQVSDDEWQEISKSQNFQNYLHQFVQEWQSAANTAERVKLKSMAMVEESLPEFYARMHDRDESLNAKTEVLKTISRFAGMGGNVDTGVVGEKFSVTINLGADQQLRFERDVTPQVIEGDTE